MEQLNWIKKSQNADGKKREGKKLNEKHYEVQGKVGIPCRRPCRIVDGSRYLLYSRKDQDKRLQKYWKSPIRPVCEHCRKTVAIVGLSWPLFGLCSRCYEEGFSDDTLKTIQSFLEDSRVIDKLCLQERFSRILTKLGRT